MLEVWGTVPPYQGRGRPPTRKQPGADWKYLQVVKQRDDHHRVTGTRIEVVYGEPETVLTTLGANTAYVERTHLTMRLSNGRLVRKTLGYSKKQEMLWAACAWEDIVYNLGRSVATLRQPCREGRRRWRQRSPMMAAGLADHIWTIEEILSTVVVALPVST